MERLLSTLGWSYEAQDTECPNLKIYSITEEVPGLEGPGDTADLAVLSLLKKGGARTFKSENGMWTVFWTYLFWDVIFKRLPEVYDKRLGPDFPSEMQDVPYDLFLMSGFYERRKELFKKRREELTSLGLKKPLEEQVIRSIGKRTRLLEAFHSFDPKDLDFALTVLPTEASLRIFDRLSEDYSANRSGLPDLFVHTDRVMLVEVKGPSDSMRQNQIDWLRYLGGRCGFEVSVLTVGWSDRKLSGLRSKLNGPRGFLTVSFESRGCEHFDEILEIVSRWDSVKRSGAGEETTVTARLRLNEIGKATPVIGRIAECEVSSASINEKGVELDPYSPLHCLIEKETGFEGKSYCESGLFRRFGCHQFDHPVLVLQHYSDSGYVDSEKGVFVFDKPRLEGEAREEIARLEVCPYFSDKPILKELNKIPSEVDPKTDDGWAWVDTFGSSWIWEGDKWVGQGEWIDKSGEEDFPGISNMTRVQPISAIDIARQFISVEVSTTVQDPLPKPEPSASPSQSRPGKSGCSLVVAAVSTILTVLIVLL